MKFAIVITLLLVAFSAVALADKSIERAVMDLITARDDDCGKLFADCTSDSDCCENWVCSKTGFVKNICKYNFG
uniref:Mu-sparatoxin-Hv2 n=1 Tax=Heteropoda venatoria TaxID=152925 RepID=TXHV2_HETVE|nr:RecName: Full=Mu-sparatoxin-Hv2; Short=Mu-SPRTX-Hv2; AltName: Full=U15-sparatoxin-Hv1a; Flags: Precursor [Heteropoda venatoria]AHF45777.1 secretory peptide [Heteropoda venatoria]